MRNDCSLFYHFCGGRRGRDVEMGVWVKQARRHIFGVRWRDRKTVGIRMCQIKKLLL